MLPRSRLLEWKHGRDTRDSNLDEVMLLPPSVRDLEPEGHFAHFIWDLVSQELDLSATLGAYTEEKGYPPYHPTMMTLSLMQDEADRGPCPVAHDPHVRGPGPADRLPGVRGHRGACHRSGGGPGTGNGTDPRRFLIGPCRARRFLTRGVVRGRGGARSLGRGG